MVWHWLSSLRIGWLLLWFVFTTTLITTSPNGDWVPETSRTSHYWHPAPSWRLLLGLVNLWKLSDDSTHRRGDRHPSIAWRHAPMQNNTHCKHCALTKLQRVQNAAARVLYLAPRFCHITPILYKLHWLPVTFRIDYKIIIITHKAIHGTAPNYLSSLVDLKPNSSYSLRSNNKYLLSNPEFSGLSLLLVIEPL